MEMRVPGFGGDSERSRPNENCCFFGVGRLQNPWQRLCSSHGEMDRLAKLLFPNNPKMVRFRKLQALYFAVFLSVGACVAVGLVIFFLSQAHPK
jgi:hypothetical protein